MWYVFLNAVVDVAPDRFTCDKGHTQLSIPVFTSHSLENSKNGFNKQTGFLGKSIVTGMNFGHRSVPAGAA